jgi:hypothetical protein
MEQLIVLRKSETPQLIGRWTVRELLGMADMLNEYIMTITVESSVPAYDATGQSEAPQEPTV